MLGGLLLHEAPRINHSNEDPHFKISSRVVDWRPCYEISSTSFEGERKGGVPGGWLDEGGEGGDSESMDSVANGTGFSS